MAMGRFSLSISLLLIVKIGRYTGDKKDSPYDVKDGAITMRRMCNLQTYITVKANT